MIGSKFKIFVKKNPIARGILAYSIIWPTSSLIQQTIEGKRLGTYDWGRCFRYYLYGSLFVAPTLYGWIKLSSAMWPSTNLRVAITKTAVENISYGPAATSSFFFLMSLLENKTVREAGQEVCDKFLPTYKVAITFWPFVGMVNYTFIRERNRVPFIALCSFFWTIFLAFMKQSDSLILDEIKQKNEIKISRKL